MTRIRRDLDPCGPPLSPLVVDHDHVQLGSLSRVARRLVSSTATRTLGLGGPKKWAGRGRASALRTCTAAQGRDRPGAHDRTGGRGGVPAVS